jgi:hypothetical protein
MGKREGHARGDAGEYDTAAEQAYGLGDLNERVGHGGVDERDPGNIEDEQ